MLVGAAFCAFKDRPSWVARFANPPAREINRAWRPLAQWLVRDCDVCVANSTGLGHDVAKYLDIRFDNITVLQNPVDIARLDRMASQRPIITADRRPVLVTMGRMSRQKRHDLLIEGFARVCRYHDCELWICGDGRGRAQIEANIRKHGLESRVRLLGFLDNPHATLRQSDLFVLTSDYEGLPNALIEAQMLGIPAVATRCPFGPDEIIDHEKTGILIDVGDVHAMVRAIDELLRDPARRRKMGDLAKQSVRPRFAAARIINKWEELLQRLSRR